MGGGIAQILPDTAVGGKWERRSDGAMELRRGSGWSVRAWAPEWGILGHSGAFVGMLRWACFAVLVDGLGRRSSPPCPPRGGAGARGGAGGRSREKEVGCRCASCVPLRLPLLLRDSELRRAPRVGSCAEIAGKVWIFGFGVGARGGAVWRNASAGVRYTLLVKEGIPGKPNAVGSPHL